MASTVLHVWRSSNALLASVAAITMMLSGCADSGGKHVLIELGPTHLVDNPAGSWLKMFDIDYSSGAERFKKQITNQLRQEGELVEEYIGEENGNSVQTFIWNYRGHKFTEKYYKGGIWKGPKIIPFQEYYGEGWNSWVTFFPAAPIAYVELLSERYIELQEQRNYEHAATIVSEIDQERRLFLFGYGENCERITLF